MKKLIICFALLMFMFSLLPAADPPERINYQGVLRDSSDKPINTTVDMKFRLYDDPLAGILLWEEDYSATNPPAITPSNGLFSVALGDAAHRTAGSILTFIDIFKNYTNVYLAIVAGTDSEMTPRIEVISSAYALNAKHLGGRGAGEFLDTSTTAQTKYAQLTIDSPGGYGVIGKGPTAGGYGIDASGSAMGGYFKDFDNSGFAEVGVGDSGIQAYGNTRGGYFSNLISGSAVNVATGGYGVEGWGVFAGGSFSDLYASGYAYAGYGDYGIYARGNFVGGFFQDDDSNARAYVAYGNYGIWAAGNGQGGYFGDLDNSGYAYVGYWDNGIESYGNSMGGSFTDLNSSGWGWVGYSSYKIYGSGTVSFVQNHPYNKDQVIVYAAPEGDEVATYTRGTARLINGEARIPLGETFKWVTNPDIGLTAYLTPHGDCNGLYMDSLTTSELIVKELGSGTGNVSFDYIVYGLRIGFEESSIVQEKKHESWIPSMKDHRDLYATHPELQSYNSLERFKKMRTNIGAGETLDLSSSIVLKNAVHEYEPAVDGPADKNGTEMPIEPQPPELDNQAREQAIAQSQPNVPPAIVRDTHIASSANASGLPMDDEGNIYGKSFRPSSHELASSLQVNETVEVGDVLVADPVNPGNFCRGSKANDSGVVGIVAGEPGVVLGAKMPADESDTAEAAAAESMSIESMQPLQAPVALSGIVLCKVDASYGSISVGDVLTTSSTPGYAMRADNPKFGTILGKALEPLDAGTGLIKVLVMLR